MMKNWRDITYLEKGDNVQKKVLSAIVSVRVMELLKAFDPILAGTYPIGIYVPGSDIDIVCNFADDEAFIDKLEQSYASMPAFAIKTKKIRSVKSVIARFLFDGFVFEIFGQAIPTEKQFAYRHMLIEYEILEQNDSRFREEIIYLKQKGLSTEEAFAMKLGIEGDPYTGLLEYFLSIT